MKSAIRTLLVCLVAGGGLPPAICAAAGSVATVTVPGSVAAVTEIAQLPASHASSPNLSRDLLRVRPERPEYRETLAYLDAVSRFGKALALAQDEQGVLRVEATGKGRRADATKVVLQTLGCSVSSSRGVVQVRCDVGKAAPEDVRALARSGIDVSQIGAALVERKEATIRVPTFDVPLPLGGRVWSSVVLRRPLEDADVFPAILAEPQAALLYEGLLTLDAATLDYLATHPEIVERLYRQGAEGLAAFGRSVHIRDGKVIVPGGDEYRAAWEALIGESTSKPQQFLGTLLTLEDGRVGFLFDALANLSDSHIRFLLNAKDRRAVPKTLSRLYEAVSEPLFGPRKALRERGWPPFVWPAADPFPSIKQLRVTSEGVLVGLRSKRLWNAVLDDDGLTVPVGVTWAPRDASDEVDGVWLLQRLTNVAGLKGRAFRTDGLAVRDLMRFAQRTLGDGPQPADEVVLCLKGFLRFPAALLTLERAGLRSAPVYAATVRKIAEVSAVGDDADRWFRVTGLQASLGLVERLTFAHAISAAQAEELVASLAALPVVERRGFGGRLATWVRDDLGRIVAPVDRDPVSFELQFFDAASGAKVAPAVFSWEGRSYQTNIAGWRAAQMRTVRAGQRGPDVPVALKMGALLSALAGETLSAVDMQAVVADALSAAHALPVGERYESGIDTAPTIVLAAVEQIAERVARKGKPEQRDLLRLELAVDALCAEALRGLLYAVSVPPTGVVTSFDGREPYRHNFGGAAGHPLAEAVAWSLPTAPTELQGRQWSIRGCLCSIDVAMIELALNGVSDRPPETRRRLRAEDSHAVSSLLALVDRFALTSDEMTAIAAAVREGRALLASPQGEGVWSRASAAGVSSARIELLEWMRARVATAPTDITAAVERLVSPAEIYRVGRPPGGAEFSGRWSASMPAYDGCLCTAWPDAGPWEYYAGRTGTGYLGASSADVMVQTAVLMSALNVPPVLAPEIVRRVVLEVVDHAQMVDPDDWLGVVSAVTHVTTQDVERIVSDLTGTDMLVPVQSRR